MVTGNAASITPLTSCVVHGMLVQNLIFTSDWLCVHSMLGWSLMSVSDWLCGS